MRAILEPLESKIRWNFLDEIGDNTKLFDSFKTNSELLKGFNRYRFEPHWIDEFDQVFSNHLSAILIEPIF